MIVKIEINLDTLEVTSNEEAVTITDSTIQGRILLIEVSKPDPQPEQTWQQ